MSGVLDDLTTWLTAQAFAGGTTGWTLTRRRMLDAPAADPCVVLTEDGGSAPDIPSADGIGDAAMEDVGVLISVRAAAWDSDASAAKAEAIRAALHGQRNLTLGATTYLRAVARTPTPIFAGFDAVHRPVHTISVLLLRAVPASP